MMRTLFNIIKIAPFLLALGVIFISCKQEEFSKDKLYSYNGQYPDESAEDLHLTYSDSGRLSFEITTPILNKYYKNNILDCPEGIEIISYDNFGQPEAVMRADYAINAERDMHLEAQKNVIITNLKKGDTIKTEKIIWDKRRSRIYSDVPVRQIRADGTVYNGDGFDADERFTRYTVRNPRGEIIADDL